MFNVTITKQNNIFENATGGVCPTTAEIVPETPNHRVDKTRGDVDNQMFCDYANDDNESTSSSVITVIDRKKINKQVEYESSSTIPDKKLCSDAKTNEEITLWEFLTSDKNIESMKFYEKYGYDHEPHDLSDDDFSTLSIDRGYEISDETEDEDPINQQLLSIERFKIEQFIETMRIENNGEDDHIRSYLNDVIDEPIPIPSLQKTEHTQETQHKLDLMLKYLKEK